MKYIFFFLLFFSFRLSAQVNQRGLIFSTTEFNYGKVENWISRIDSIKVTNTTTEKVFILKQHYPSDFEVRFPIGGIESGESGFVEIIFNPKKKGKFKRSIALYHTASFDSVSIKFKGEVLSFDPYAMQECPSFSAPQKKRTEFDIDILLIDSLTQKPLANSFVEIAKGDQYVQYKTDENGQLKVKSFIGLFVIYADHPDYNSKEFVRYFNPQNNSVIITLLPVKNETVIEIKKEDVLETITKDTLKYYSTFSSETYKENHFVFLIDVSQSMNTLDRLPLLKKSMYSLVGLMRVEDKITVVTYADNVHILLTSVSGLEKEKILNVIDGLTAKGNTEGAYAIEESYAIAQQHFIVGGVNQIILATDGGFTGLAESKIKLQKLVKKRAKKGICFSVLTFGNNKTGKKVMEEISVDGGGFYLFMEDEKTGKEKLIEKVKKMSKK